jgi:hypothetical protein
MRQIWRNHLLGISMIENKDIKKFTSVIVYPSGNAHFNKVIPEYQSILTDNNKNTLIGCAFEKYIDSIQDDDPNRCFSDLLKFALNSVSGFIEPH